MTLLQPSLALGLTSLLACLGLGTVEPMPTTQPASPVLSPVSGDLPSDLPDNIPGNCGLFSCPDLLGQLHQRYPDRTAQYLANCPDDPAQGYAAEGELALNIYEHNGSQRVDFYCWEQFSDGDHTDGNHDGGDRSGFVLGILPYPGEQAGFPVAIASDDPAIQAELERYAPMVSQMGFDCAVAGGEINILSEARQMSLQCYFWAGAILIDTNDDGVADGELSMGASVDFTRELGRDSSQNRGTPVDLMQSR